MASRNENSEVPPRSLYQYEPLVSAREFFRLLRILPGLEEDMIKCELVNKGFPPEQCTGELPYTALSYQWGPPSRYAWILIDERCIGVGENLFEFLQAARIHSAFQSGSDSSGFLWIDAMCINQQDIEEKQHQITVMGQIYSLAECVVTWLGPHVSPTVETAATALYSLGMESKLTEGRRVHFDDPFEPIANRIIQPNSTSLPAILELVNNSYWSRMWIIQEILKAPQARLMIGHHIFSWEVIKRLTLSTPTQSHKGIQGAPTARLVRAFRSTDDGQSPFARSICGTVARLSTGGCENIRDRVFSVIGLVNDTEYFLVDYSMTCQQLFYNVIVSSFYTRQLNTEAATIDIPGPFRSPLDVSGLIAACLVTVALQIPLSSIEDHLPHELRNVALDCVFGGKQHVQHHDNVTFYCFALFDRKGTPHDFESISITICIPNSRQEQTYCKVECKLNNNSTSFTRLAKLARPPTSILKSGALPMQAFLFALNVIHSVYLRAEYTPAIDMAQTVQHNLGPIIFREHKGRFMRSTSRVMRRAKVATGIPS